MKYAYEDLSDTQFEHLVVLLCQRLLGMAVQGFATGPDGGRDGKFVGTAEVFPSRAEPWKGTTIIQAKHTNGTNRHFSESDFFSPDGATTVLGKELPRIQTLRANKQLDNYMLFANRRLSGLAEADIRAHIAKNCHLPEQSIYLCGIEQLEMWLKSYADVARLSGIDPIDSPLIVSPDDLAEVVQALAREQDGLKAALDDAPIKRLSYDKKNVLNNMTAEYEKEMRRRYLKETAQIKSFLAAPENQSLLRLYESVADEFQMKIIAHRKEYQTFDKVMEYLLDLLFARDPILRQRSHKRLTRAMLFYMYWNCDIGEKEDAAAN